VIIREYWVAGLDHGRAWRISNVSEPSCLYVSPKLQIGIKLKSVILELSCARDHLVLRYVEDPLFWNPSLAA